MNAHGGTESKKKGIYMLQDGSLRITKVQMIDVTTYQCKVTPRDGTDPTDHNITLFLKEQGKICINPFFFSYFLNE